VYKETDDSEFRSSAKHTASQQISELLIIPHENMTGQPSSGEQNALTGWN
jgi:hypothetical protein